MSQTIAEKLAELRRRNQAAEAGGGAERKGRQHKEGKLSARERVELLLDEGTFEELDRLVTHRSTAFNMESQKIPGDGVVGGYGRTRGARSSSSRRISPSFAARSPRPTRPKSARSWTAPCRWERPSSA